MKVVLTLTDTGRGTVDVELDFNPPIDDSTKSTPASSLALDLMDHINAISKSPSPEASSPTPAA